MATAKIFELTSTTASSLYDIGTVKMEKTSGGLTLEVSVSGDDTTNFIVQIKPHHNADFHDFLSSSDFDSTSISNMIFSSSVGPHQLSDGGSSLVVIDVNHADSVKFRANSTAGGGTITIKGRYV